MNISSIIKTSLVIFLTSSVTIAQTERPKVQARAQQTQAQAKPIAASAPLKRTKVEAKLNLPVEGLTAENAETVSALLAEIKVKSYGCEKCEAAFAKAGECTACKAPLVMTEEAVLKSVEADPAKHQIVISTEPGMELQLAHVQRALRTNEIKIDDAKLVIPGNATLQIAGATSEEHAKAIQMALTESKLFKGVRAKVRGNGIAIRVMAGASAATHAQVQTVLGEINADFKLHNVIWNDWSPAAKETKGAAKAPKRR